MSHNNDTDLNEAGEISIKELLQKAKLARNFLVRKWLQILLVSLFCGLLGLGYSFYKKTIFIASCTFVLDDGSKSDNISRYSGLASLAGIDLRSGSGGIFQGDNIIQLYKSRLMIAKTLLTEVNINGRHMRLIDLYIDYNRLRDSWDKDQIRNISFNVQPGNLNRKQDSLITDFVDNINKKILSVEKPDKKLDIIRVQVTSTNELFSKLFNDGLVENVNKFFVQTKTKNAVENVSILERQADSIRRILNNSISGVASSIDNSPNANPLLATLKVPSQRKQIDVQSNTAIYAEVIKNLEIAKITLRQELPLIQVIDKPIYPLTIEKPGKARYFFMFFFTAGFLFSLVLLIHKILIRILEN